MNVADKIVDGDAGEEQFGMHVKGKYSWTKHLDFMIVDLAALFISFFLSFYFKFRTLEISPTWRRFLLIISMLNLLIDFVVNPYSGIIRRRYYHEIGRAFFIVGANALSMLLIFYGLKIGAEYSRSVVFITYILYFALSVILKYIWKKLLTSGKIGIQSTRKMSLFLISDMAHLERDARRIYSTEMPLYELKGVHVTDDEGGECLEMPIPEGGGKGSIPIVGADFVNFILENNIREVLITVAPDKLESGFFRRMIENGVGVDLAVESILGFQTEEQLVTNIGVHKALSVGQFSFSPSQSVYLFVKRVFDILCGMIGLIILVPITAVVKLCYVMTGDRESIFYQQKRVGMNGKPIRIWKYRSMVPNADEILQTVLRDGKYRKEWEKNQKLEKDPRVTKVGAFLRKTSIDELPQLINVLKGDMSIVGPRPLVEGELAAHKGLKLYEKVKPGITGWWGCNGRSSIDYRERLELEYYYVKNCSFYLDMLCIIRTIFAVLKGEGAG